MSGQTAGDIRCGSVKVGEDPRTKAARARGKVVVTI
jgi:hypothetical protein